MANKRTKKKTATSAKPRRKATKKAAASAKPRAKVQKKKAPAKSRPGAAKKAPRKTASPPSSQETLEQSQPVVVILRTDEREVCRIHDGSRLQQMAISLSYRVRNRVRWNDSQRGREEQAENCAALTKELGLSKHDLQHIADRGIVEVSVPFTEEGSGWAPRILPWEYLLSGATSALRTEPLTIVRHLDRERAASPRREVKKVAVVIGNPAEIQDVYNFSEERNLAGMLLKSRRKPEFIEHPTLTQLRDRIRQDQPDVVHIAGVDTHQGAELISRLSTETPRDGMILSDANNSAVAVETDELASALTSARRKPALIVFNLYHSASRTAAMAVAKGADAALGFQDTFDDQAAELFISDFYRAWANTGGDALVAFQAGWVALRKFPKRLEGTGVVLWSARSLVRDVLDVRRQAETQHKAIESGRLSPVKIRSVSDAQKWLRISCVPLSSLNYSLLHNRRSLFEEFTLSPAVDAQGSIEDVRVEVELWFGLSPMPFRVRKTVDHRGVDLTEEVFFPLTSELARTLKESVETSLNVKVSVGEYVARQEAFRVTLLPIVEWVDDDVNRQFLPSFVWPNDPAVRRVIAKAEPYLHALADDPTAGFDGYQCIDPEADDPAAGVDLQVAAIWRGLLDFQLGYINPPPTYTQLSQRLRTPSDILDGGRGTCIDLALMLAACLEYVDIFPAVFLLEGHAFPGYWRSEEGWDEFVRLNDGVDQEAGAVGRRAGQPAMDLGDNVWMFPSSTKKTARRAISKLLRAQIEAGNLVALESVWLTTHSSFQEAIDDGWDNLAKPSEFNSLIDIKSARGAARPVTPLPLGVTRS